MTLGLFVAIYTYFNIIHPKTPTIIMASDVLRDNLKDPRVTDRAYYTETTGPTGPIGDFVGYSPVSQYDWLHGLPHEESKDKGGEYDEIRRLIQRRK